MCVCLHAHAGTFASADTREKKAKKLSKAASFLSSLLKGKLRKSVNLDSVKA